MKKLLLITALLFTCGATAIQAKKVYAELVGYQKGLFSNKIMVRVDFGQNVNYWKQGDMVLVDKEGKDIVFNSMVEAMNFMGGNGWEFVQAYVVTEGNQNVYHWMMTKDIQSEEDIKEGFNIRADNNSPKDEAPVYFISFMRKHKKDSEWDVVKTETKHLTTEEALKIMEEWKAQTNDLYDYDCQIKKNK